jgi:hypothetical protein
MGRPWLLSDEKLVLTAQDLRKIPDIQRAKSDRGTVPVAAVVEPVVAVFDRVSTAHVEVPVRLTAARETVERVVQQSDPAALPKYSPSSAETPFSCGPTKLVPPQPSVNRQILRTVGRGVVDTT